MPFECSVLLVTMPALAGGGLEEAGDRAGDKNPSVQLLCSLDSAEFLKKKSNRVTC